MHAFALLAWVLIILGLIFFLFGGWVLIIIGVIILFAIKK